MTQKSFDVPLGAAPLSPGAISTAPAPVKPSKVVDLREAADEIKEIGSIGAAAEPAAPSPRINLCPQCGTDIAAFEELLPTEEERERWVRHVLGEFRFTKTYELFGRLKVTFRSRTVEENGAIYDQVRADMQRAQREKGVKASDSSIAMDPRFLLQLNSYFLVASLESLTDPNGTENFDVLAAYEATDDKVAIEVAYARLLPSLSEGLAGTLIHALGDFDRLTATMVRHADRPDFW